MAIDWNKYATAEAGAEFDYGTTNVPKTQEKSINLSASRQDKINKLSNRKPIEEPMMQDFTNTLKGAANYVLPKSMEFDRVEVDEGKAYLLGDEGRIGEVYEATDSDGGMYWQDAGSGDDGDTIGGNRTAGIDTPESFLQTRNDGKMQRIKNNYDVDEATQRDMGLIAKEASKKFLDANPNVTATVEGTDVNGRSLVRSPEYNEYMIGNGYAVPDSSATAKELELYEKAKSEGLGLHSDYGVGMQAIELDLNRYNSEDGKVYGKGFVEKLSNVASAAGATFAKPFVGLADIVAETFGGDLGTDEELSKNVNEFFGYDARVMSQVNELAGAKVEKMNKDGYTISGVLDVIEDFATTPEMAGELIGFVGSMAVGWGGQVAKAGKEYKAAKTAKETAEKAGDVAKVVSMTTKMDEAKDVLDSASTAKKALSFAGTELGFIANTTSMSSADVEAYAKEAGITVDEVPMDKRLAIVAGNALLNKLDFAVDKAIFFNPSMREGALAVIKGMTKGQLEQLGVGLAKVTGAAVIGGAAEYGTEYQQQFITQINQQVGEATGKTIADAWNDENNSVERTVSGLAGAAGAQQLNAPGAIAGTVAGLPVMERRAEEKAAVQEEARVKAEQGTKVANDIEDIIAGKSEPVSTEATVEVEEAVVEEEVAEVPEITEEEFVVYDELVRNSKIPEDEIDWEKMDAYEVEIGKRLDRAIELYGEDPAMAGHIQLATALKDGIAETIREKKRLTEEELAELDEYRVSSLLVKKVLGSFRSIDDLTEDQLDALSKGEGVDEVTGKMFAAMKKAKQMAKDTEYKSIFTTAKDIASDEGKNKNMATYVDDMVKAAKSPEKKKKIYKQFSSWLTHMRAKHDAIEAAYATLEPGTKYEGVLLDPTGKPFKIKSRLEAPERAQAKLDTEMLGKDGNINGLLHGGKAVYNKLTELFSAKAIPHAELKVIGEKIKELEDSILRAKTDEVIADMTAELETMRDARDALNAEKDAIDVELMAVESSYDNIFVRKGDGRTKKEDGRGGDSLVLLNQQKVELNALEELDSILVAISEGAVKKVAKPKKPVIEQRVATEEEAKKAASEEVTLKGINNVNAVVDSTELIKSAETVLDRQTDRYNSILEIDESDRSKKQASMVTMYEKQKAKLDRLVAENGKPSKKKLSEAQKGLKSGIEKRQKLAAKSLDARAEKIAGDVKSTETSTSRDVLLGLIKAASKAGYYVTTAKGVTEILSKTKVGNVDVQQITLDENMTNEQKAAELVKIVGVAYVNKAIIKNDKSLDTIAAVQGRIIELAGTNIRDRDIRARVAELTELFESETVTEQDKMLRTVMLMVEDGKFRRYLFSKMDVKSNKEYAGIRGRLKKLMLDIMAAIRNVPTVISSLIKGDRSDTLDKENYVEMLGILDAAMSPSRAYGNVVAERVTLSDKAKAFVERVLSTTGGLTSSVLQDIADGLNKTTGTNMNQLRAKIVSGELFDKSLKKKGDIVLAKVIKKVLEDEDGTYDGEANNKIATDLVGEESRNYRKLKKYVDSINDTHAVKKQQYRETLNSYFLEENPVEYGGSTVKYEANIARYNELVKSARNNEYTTELKRKKESVVEEEDAISAVEQQARSIYEIGKEVEFTFEGELEKGKITKTSDGLLAKGVILIEGEEVNVSAIKLIPRKVLKAGQDFSGRNIQSGVFTEFINNNIGSFNGDIYRGLQEKKGNIQAFLSAKVGDTIPSIGDRVDAYSDDLFVASNFAKTGGVIIKATTEGRFTNTDFRMSGYPTPDGVKSEIYVPSGDVKVVNITTYNTPKDKYADEWSNITVIEVEQLDTPTKQEESSDVVESVLSDEMVNFLADEVRKCNGE